MKSCHILSYFSGLQTQLSAHHPESKGQAATEKRSQTINWRAADLCFCFFLCCLAAGGHLNSASGNSSNTGHSKAYDKMKHLHLKSHWTTAVVQGLKSVPTSSDCLLSWGCDVLTLTHIQTYSWKQQELKLSIRTTASLFRDPSPHKYSNRPFSEQAGLMHSYCMRLLCLQSRGSVKGMKMWSISELNNKCSHWNAESEISIWRPSTFQPNSSQFVHPDVCWPFSITTTQQTVAMICWLAEVRPPKSLKCSLNVSNGFAGASCSVYVPYLC